MDPREVSSAERHAGNVTVDRPHRNVSPGEKPDISVKRDRLHSLLNTLSRPQSASLTSRESSGIQTTHVHGRDISEPTCLPENEFSKSPTKESVQKPAAEDPVHYPEENTLPSCTGEVGRSEEESTQVSPGQSWTPIVTGVMSLKPEAWTERDVEFTQSLPQTTPLQCLICNDIIPDMSDFKSHIMLHGEAIGFPPPKGNTNSDDFTNGENFNGDDKIRNSPLEDEEYSHLPCSTDYKQLPVINFLNAKDGTIKGTKTFKCPMCPKTFPRSSSLRVHLVIHTGEKPHRCSECEKCFSRKGDLIVHKKIHTGEKSFECCVCEKTFSRGHSLKKHMRQHTGYKPYECGSCGEAFTRLDDLQKHIRVHTGATPFQCDVCLKVCSTSGHLKYHMKSKHTDIKPFPCDSCDMTFPDISHLKKHRVKHTGERDHKCSVCQKAFGRKCDLQKHVLIHTDDKPFPCKLCSKSFPVKSQLVNHLQSHSVGHRHQCTSCPKSFTYKTSLYAHQRLHLGIRPHACVHCGKTFVAKRDLHTHLVSHSDRKPHSCKVCNKGFVSAANLERHMVIHSGDQDFQCVICNKLFARSKSLHKHMETHSNSQGNVIVHTNETQRDISDLGNIEGCTIKTE